MIPFRVNELKTPALLVDLDCMESNLSVMANYFADRPAKLRPHFKNHQVLALAAKQMSAGAIGITCARLEHAEALLFHGITNVLVANEIAGESMIRHFIELSRHGSVTVAVDDPGVVSDMARLAGTHVHDLNVMVDLELGLGRCGVVPGEAALSITKLILEKGIRFLGLMGYGGLLRAPPGPEKQHAVELTLQPLIDTKSLIEQAGIPVEILTCGGTGDYAIAAAVPGVTEIQAGSYLLMDSSYTLFAPDFKTAVSILATVISKTPGERIVADAGLKSMGILEGSPLIKGTSGLRVKAVHAEHSIVEIVDPAVPVEIGDQIEICVKHLDPTICLHCQMYGIRKGRVETIFEIER